MAWTLPEDVIGRWIGGGAPAPTTPALINAIDDLEDSALVAYPDLALRIESGAIPLTRFKKVIAYATIRVLKTSQEFRKQFSETTGPFAQSAAFYSNPNGASLTSDELSELVPDENSANKGKVFTFSVSGPRRSTWDDDYYWFNGEL